MGDVFAMEQADVALVRKAQHDAQAFAGLYDRYFSVIYTYMLYRLRDPALADDLTAHVFEQALRSCARYTPERATFRGWLLGIARNTVRRHLRRQSLLRWIPLGPAHDTPAADNPAARLEAQALQAGLLEALARLKPREQDILALKFAGRLSNRQIAALTELSESNVGTIIHRSLTTLKDYLTAKDLIDA